MMVVLVVMMMVMMMMTTKMKVVMRNCQVKHCSRTWCAYQEVGGGLDDDGDGDGDNEDGSGDEELSSQALQ